MATFFCFISERDRILLFPDNFFFAERRFVNHIIDTKKVKDLDHCELFCYMNDKCVSANFKKEPEPGGMTHVCELNNATHLDYDTDLITDANFYHRGSKVSCNLPPWIDALYSIELYAITDVFRNFHPFIHLS